MSDDTQKQEEILAYWFGDIDSHTDVDSSRSALWWKGGDDLDAEIASKFGSLVTAARQGSLDNWCDSPRGALALTILLDQFTRNIGRGGPEAFGGDSAAQAVCAKALEMGHDSSLRLIERAFLLMPMLHAEDKTQSRAALSQFKKVQEEAVAAGAPNFPNFLGSAVQHAAIVLKFGRYPHRNEILGRTHTEEEVAFLSDGGPTFGQKKS